MLKIITVVGARPQFIKAAVVSRALAKRGGTQEHLLHTGQHYDTQMSDVFFAELGLPEPRWHLGVGSCPHGQQTGRMLEAIEAVLLAHTPEWVLVYGDTNSTLAGALAAAKLGIPVAHVEAGLRSFNRAMPEEINRVMTDHLSSVLFAPTRVAMAHLVREGVSGEQCHLVGDVMYDSVLALGDRARDSSDILRREGLRPRGFVLATIHRAENTDSPSRLGAIFYGLAEVAKSVPIVVPLHPRTRAALQALGASMEAPSGLRFISAVGYFDMLALEGAARLIVTDSGGVQKEAFFHRVPCVTLREETEWTELVDAGWNHLVVPLSAEVIYAGVSKALHRSIPAEPADPLYGGGLAGERIASTLASLGTKP